MTIKDAIIAHACWKARDVAIAEAFGVSREFVRQIRRELGKPDPKTKHIRTPRGVAFAAWATENKERLASMNFSQMVEEFGPIASSNAHSILTALGVKFQPAPKKQYSNSTICPYNHMNWSLSNGKLASIWGCTRLYVMMRRSQLGLGGAKSIRDITDGDIEKELAAAKLWREKRAVSP